MTHVVLTGFEALTARNSGGAVARALREGWPHELVITALVGQEISPSAWVPGIIDHVQVVDGLLSAPGDLCAEMLDVHTEREITALIPGTTQDAQIFAASSRKLSRAGVGTCLSDAATLDTLSPPALAAWANAHEIETVHPIPLINPTVGAQLANRLGYPLTVTTSFGVQWVVHTPADIEHLIVTAAPTLERPLFLFPPTAGELFSAAGVVSEDGGLEHLLLIRAHSRDRHNQIVLATAVRDKVLEAFVRRVMETLDWRGCFELEMLRMTNRKTIALCAAHCRLPAWAMAGSWTEANLATVHLSQIIKQPKPDLTNLQPSAGMISIRSVQEFAVPEDELLELRHHRRITPHYNGLIERSKDPATTASGKIRVAITGIDASDVVNPGLGVARALRQAPEIGAIYGLAAGNFDSGLYEPSLFERCITLPRDSGRRHLFERIVELQEKTPFDVLIPCLDGELDDFISLRDDLERRRIATLLPNAAALKRVSKIDLFMSCSKRDFGGFLVPESACIECRDDALADARNFGLPAVLKGPVSDCIVLRKTLDAGDAFDRLALNGAEQAILQRRIDGEAYAVSVVCDRAHHVLASLAIKKLATCSRGSTWSARICRQDELEQSFARLLEELKWVGPAEGEFIRDPLTGRFYLIEINPRFTAWIFYSAALGGNQPLAAVQAALGLPVDRIDSNRSLIFMRSATEHKVPAGRLAGLISMRQ